MASEEDNEFEVFELPIEPGNTDLMGWLRATHDSSVDDGIFEQDGDDNDDGDSMLKEHRACASVDVCEKKHRKTPKEVVLWAVVDVFSVTITRNDADNSPVFIHGAIKVISGDKGYYIFKRNEKDAQVFESPGEKLTLSLQGPVGLSPFLVLGRFEIFFALKYNGEDIFPLGQIVLPRYVDDDSDEVFGVGFESFFLCGAEGLIDSSVDDLVLCRQISSVDVEIGQITSGVLARLRFVVSRDLCLHGEISARSCNFPRGIVVFQRREDEAVEVKTAEFIPLLRSTACVSYGSSLVIEFALLDRKDNSFALTEAVLLPARPEGLSKKSISNGVIQVKIGWVNPAFVD